MSDGLPGYDAWKTMSPDDEDPRCEHCGASEKFTKGWQPRCCTGECNIRWRDPDAEYEAQRDEPREEIWFDDDGA